MTSLQGRAADMQDSVARVAGANGVSASDVALVVRAHQVAMEARHEVLGDPEHPLYLHPGRNVLILVRDAGLRSGCDLAVAALVESREPRLRADPARVRADLPAPVADAWARVPMRGMEGLAEALVTSNAALRMAALADHLDHLRHLHMLPRTDDWADLFDEVVAVWGPVAERTHPELARRYALWVRTFRRRR